MSTGPVDRSWRIGKTDDYLEESLLAKYLGINLQLRGRNILKHEQDIVKIARRYAFSILSLTRAGLDRAIVARKLWEMCALPAFTYGNYDTLQIYGERIGEDPMYRGEFHSANS